MKKFRILLLTIMFICISVSLNAAPLIPNNGGTPNLFEAVNLLIDTSYTSNADIASRQTNNDQVWYNMDEYGNEPWAVIGLSAGYTNTLGIYTDPGVGAVRTDLWTGTGFDFLGDGTAANPFPGDKFGNVVTEGSNFGFYLFSDGTDYLYSETSLNANGFDYMTTYALPELIGETIFTDNNGTKLSWTVKGSAYLIGFEDIVGGGDGDYNDTMFLVSKIAPVPEPTTMILFGIGLLGLAGINRKKHA